MSNKYYAHESSIIDKGVQIGNGTKIWHFNHISSGAKIGENCTLGQNIFVGGKAIIGNNVKIQNNVSVYDGVTLEDYVFCGPSMVFTNDLSPRSKYPKKGELIKTIVKEGVSIGANVTIVCGITIGKYAFVGSGTVVTKNVPDYALVFGNPGKIQGWVCECGEKLDTDTEKITCIKCSRNFQKTGDILSEK